MFAASFTTWTGSSLRQLRGSAITTLRQLQRRWQPVTKQLRKFQTAAISKVTAQRDVGFTALLVLLVNWSNTLLPYGLIAGLPAVGYSISSRQVEVPLGSRSDISAPMMSGFHFSYVAHILQHLRDFLHELQGCILVCNCAHHKCCEADIFGFGASTPTMVQEFLFSLCQGLGEQQSHQSLHPLAFPCPSAQAAASMVGLCFCGNGL